MDNLQSKIIILNNRKDIEIVLLILKDNVSVYFPDFQDDNDTDIIDWLDGKKFIDIEDDLSKTNILESYDKILALSEKIGIPLEFKEKVLSTNTAVGKELVHKKKSENVMVSESARIRDTNVFYLQGFFRTSEITLDHEAGDHVESVILTEICRQACLSTSEEALSGEEHLIPTEDVKIYKRFVTSDSPLVIQVIAEKTKKRKGYCVFALYQDGKCCMKGYMLGRIFKNKSSFEEMRAYNK
ncbi:AfsA-related hotdog domain-containing protein [Streptococcus sp. H31]|uniref:AfsA-related hotdog domain-containing protein n=1 Tax=Streptococcus huangxiaojuni TaxID=3237239 RepID=UPI0034A38188